MFNLGTAEAGATMPKEPPDLIAPPNMIGAKVFLRPTTPLDITNMYHWSVLSDPQSMTCHPRIYRSAEETAEAFKREERSEREQRFTVVRSKDKAAVGLIRYFGYNALNRSAELGLLVDPDEQRQGYGTDAVKVLANFLFDYRGLNKVYAQTAGFNEGAVALLKGLGFKRDAVLRDHFFYRGVFHEGYIYSLLLFERQW